MENSASSVASIAAPHVKHPVGDGELRTLIRHYERMALLPGANDHDKVAALLKELLDRRRAAR